MRRFFIVAFCTLIAAAAVAQEKPTSLTLFVTPEGGGTSDGHTYWNGGFGFAVQRMFPRRISAELSVEREWRHIRQPYTVFTPGEMPVTTYRNRTYNTWPVDLDAAYHFAASGDWKPYAGAGLRYIHRPSLFTHSTRQQLLPELVGGVVWQMRPGLGIRLDGKLRAGKSSYDERFKGSAGLTWRF